jgi:hypothetical protein
MVTEGVKRNISTGVRWLARGTGTFLIGMVALFAVGEGIPDLTGQPAAVQAELFALGLMLVGFALGWRWEAVGGGLALGGFITFCGAELLANGRLPGGAIPLLCIPGLLFLISYLLNAHPNGAEEN